MASVLQHVLRSPFSDCTTEAHFGQVRWNRLRSETFGTENQIANVSLTDAGSAPEMWRLKFQARQLEVSDRTESKTDHVDRES